MPGERRLPGPDRKGRWGIVGDLWRGQKRDLLEKCEFKKRWALTNEATLCTCEKHWEMCIAVLAQFSSFQHCSLVYNMLKIHYTGPRYFS